MHDLMAIAKRTIVIYIWVISWAHTFAEIPFKAYRMGDTCSGHISMVHEHIYAADIEMTVTSSIEARGSCNLTLESRVDMPYLNLDFYTISLLSCSETQLYISTGSQLDTLNPYPELSLLCGQSSERLTKTSFSSTDKYLQLRFKWSMGVANRTPNFRLLVNSYKEGGSCVGFGEFSCDNGRCINDSLTCQNYNPCGDQSDCNIGGQTLEESTFNWWSVPLIIGFIIFCWIVIKGIKSNPDGGCCSIIGDILSTCCACMGSIFRHISRFVSATRDRCHNIHCFSEIRHRCSGLPEVCANRITCGCVCTIEAPHTTGEAAITATSASNTANTSVLENTSSAEDPPPPYFIDATAPPLFDDIAVDRPPDYTTCVGGAMPQDIAEPPPHYDVVMANKSLYRTDENR